MRFTAQVKGLVVCDSPCDDEQHAEVKGEFCVGPDLFHHLGHSKSGAHARHKFAPRRHLVRRFFKLSANKTVSNKLTEDEKIGNFYRKFCIASIIIWILLGIAEI